MSILSENIDANPYVGERKVVGQLRASTAEWLDGYFNGAPNYDQVKGITRGKIYDVIKVIGLGDVEDVVVIDDNREEHKLGSFFFEKVN